MGESLVERLWGEVDACYHKFNNDNTMTADQVENLKGYMRGISWSLSIFMNPHFRTADEIVAEVHKRYIMKQAGNDEYCTVGTGRRAQEMPGGSKYAQTKTAPPAITHNLNENQIGKIKAALAAGFVPEEIAGMYSVSVAIIKGL